MEKTNLNNPRSGEGCSVLKKSTHEQKYIENRERKLIEDKGNACVSEFSDDTGKGVIKGWFGWWACALLAVAVIGLCLYFATRDSQPTAEMKAYNSTGSTQISSPGQANSKTYASVSTGARKVVNKKVVVLKQVRVPGAASISRENAVDGNKYASESSIDKAAALEASVDYIYYFGNDKSAVADNQLLDEIAQKAGETGAEITVTAYASETGTPAYNRQLTEERASNLAEYLVARGVPADHIRINAGGQTDRYGDYALNRRADIVVDYAG